jgi:hypothetical protein
MTAPVSPRDLFLCWGKELIRVKPQDVSDALDAAHAIQDRSELLRLRRRAKRDNRALQCACLDSVVTGQPLQLLQRAPAHPNSYDIV